MADLWQVPRTHFFQIPGELGCYGFTDYYLRNKSLDQLYSEDILWSQWVEKIECSGVNQKKVQFVKSDDPGILVFQERQPKVPITQIHH